MQSDNSSPGATRQPWIALAMTLVATGVGHLYCGRIVRGLMLFSVWLLLMPLAWFAARSQPSTPLLLTLLVMPAVSVLVIYFWACVDAWRIASDTTTPYIRRDYNHLVVYVVMLLVGATYPFLVLTHLRSSSFEGFVITGESMSPSLAKGDRVIVNKSRGRTDPRRFDVVTFHAPENAGAQWIKRVIGLPGETIEIRQNELYVDGVVVEVPDRTELPVELNSVTTPAGSAFVLGDNGKASRDSRHIGAIPLSDVTGVVEYVFLPARDWSRFGEFR